MRRGDLVTVAMPGDFGKPRPALVIQSDQFSATATATVLLISATPIDAPSTKAVPGMVEMLPWGANSRPFGACRG